MPRFKQLIPRTYWSVVGRERDGEIKQVFVIWRMWLGRVSDVTEISA